MRKRLRVPSRLKPSAAHSRAATSVALQIAFTTFGHFRQRDDHRPIEPLVPPAPIERSRERHQFALGRRRLDRPPLLLVARLSV